MTYKTRIGKEYGLKISYSGSLNDWPNNSLGVISSEPMNFRLIEKSFLNFFQLSKKK